MQASVPLGLQTFNQVYRVSFQYIKYLVSSHFSTTKRRNLKGPIEICFLLLHVKKFRNPYIFVPLIDIQKLELFYSNNIYMTVTKTYDIS